MWHACHLEIEPAIIMITSVIQDAGKKYSWSPVITNKHKDIFLPEIIIKSPRISKKRQSLPDEVIIAGA